MTPTSPGPLIVMVGVVVVLIGVLVWSGALSWFGRLPGDIRYERDTVRVYVPIVSMILVSAIVSRVLYLGRRFF